MVAERGWMWVLKWGVVWLSAALITGCASTASPRDTSPVPAGHYRNPVVEHDHPDPYVLHHRGRFYCYTTESGETGVQVLESDDLIHWTHRGIACIAAWSDGDHWAPEVVERDGRFWMYFSARNPTTRAHDLAVAESSSPLGPFKDRGVLIPGAGEVEREWNEDPAQAGRTPDEPTRGAIDPTVFQDAGGSRYLIYSQEFPRAIVMRPLGDDMVSLGAERVELMHADRDAEQGVVEAPTLLARDGVYHLFYSAGPFQGRVKGQRYTVWHATAPALRGPWVKASQPLMQSVPGKVYGPGHQCIVTLPSDRGSEPEMWLVYHGWDAQGKPRYGENSIGRSLRIDRLWWEDGRPVTDGPTMDVRAGPTVR